MPDRGPRNPAPLYANGRMFVLGNRVLFGMDAYNGTILWSLHAPELRRSNMTRDSSPMAAAADRLYVAIGAHCHALDAGTGERALKFSPPVSNPADGPFDWGYVAVVGDLLIGSVTARDAGYLGDDGEWFEGDGDADAAKVVSRRLFALDRHTGAVKWVHDGLVVNSTIAIAEGTVYLIEQREGTPRLHRGRLMGDLPSPMHLVALALDGGEERWARPNDFHQCRFMLYLSAGKERLIVCGSDRGKVYHTYAFSRDHGKLLWELHDKDRKGHHSGACCLWRTSNVP